jgi:hypothetical protein
VRRFSYNVIMGRLLPGLRSHNALSLSVLVATVNH